MFFHLFLHLELFQIQVQRKNYFQYFLHYLIVILLCNNSTIAAEIFNPKPVPPNFLVVELSACVNASKILLCLSMAIPRPSSFTSRVLFAYYLNHFLNLYLY